MISGLTSKLQFILCVCEVFGVPLKRVYVRLLISMCVFVYGFLPSLLILFATITTKAPGRLWSMSKLFERMRNEMNQI